MMALSVQEMYNLPTVFHSEVVIFNLILNKHFLWEIDRFIFGLYERIPQTSLNKFSIYSGIFKYAWDHPQKNKNPGKINLP